MAAPVGSISKVEKEFLAEMRKIEVFINFDEAYAYFTSNSSKFRNDLRSLDRNPYLGKEATKKKQWLTTLFAHKREYETIKANLDPAVIENRKRIAAFKAVKASSASAAPSVDSFAPPPAPAPATVVFSELPPALQEIKSVDDAIYQIRLRKEREALANNVEAEFINAAKKKVVRAKASIKTFAITEVKVKVETASASASPEKEDEPVCCVCFDIFSKENSAVQLCDSEVREKEHPGVHVQCMQNYISSLIDNNVSASKCPQVLCLCDSHISDQRVILPYKKWKAYATTEQLEKYRRSSEYFLYFLCGGCHRSRVHLVSFDDTATIKCLEADFSLNVVDFDFALEAYMEGLISPKEMYNKMEESFSWWKVKKPDQVRVWECMKRVFAMIQDPERRAALQSYSLSQRPFFRTLCCSSSHCFQCKTSAHIDSPCSAVIKQLDSSVMPCPQCNVFLAKGDGCNSVVCHCGYNFHWAEALRNYKSLLHFSEIYGQNAHTSCAEILCGFLKGDVDGSLVWFNKYRKVVEGLIGDVFFAKHGPYGFYGFAKEGYFLGMQNIVVESFRGLYKKEIEKQIRSNEMSIASLAQTMYPNVNDLLFVFNFFKHMNTANLTSCEKEIFASVSKHVESMKSKTLTSLTRQKWSRSMASFLYFFSQCDVTTGFFIHHSPTSKLTNYQWDKSISNDTLEFSPDELSIKRIGSSSSYPAAFCKMHFTNVNKFSVQLVGVPPSLNNAVSFGVCKMTGNRPSLPIRGSDGVGHTRNSYGFFEVRRDGANGKIFANSNNNNGSTHIATWRQLKKYDILTAEYNKITCVLKLSLNHDEFSTQMELPQDEYCFAMTLATDHKFTIVKDTPTASKTTNKTFIGLCENQVRTRFLNDDQSVQYHHMLQFLNYIAVTPFKTLEEEVKAGIKKYIKLHSSCIDLLDSELDYIQIVKSLVNEKPLGLNKPLSFEDMVFGFYLDVVGSEKQYQNKIVKLAEEFQSLHKEGAPFMAAAICCGSEGRPSERDVEMAVAFMMEHPQECNEWYTYNASLPESLLSELSRVPRSCKCLPRCLRSCKNA